MPSRRRTLQLVAALGASALARPTLSQQAEVLRFASAGPGSAFLPYARGLTPVLAAAGPFTVEVQETKGSIENLGLIEGSSRTIGTVFLGSAYEAANGSGFAAGRRHGKVRALFPMYETSFQAAALTAVPLRAARDLDGKRVGVGPANGPAEAYFVALAELIGIKPIIVNGTPADLAAQLARAEIDALWQGAVVPIPSLVDAGAKAPVTVFGLSDGEVAAMRQRYPFMAEAVLAPGTYKGQEGAIKSVAAWNFVLANADLTDGTAYALTKAVLEVPDLATRLGPPGRGTSAIQARTNTVVPFHPGAVRYYRERGIQVFEG
ncbi:MAG TPA: TAXI family TRAP transporter solute-binding subunit [Beijerinckiaceae bacterium]|jgi:TRAP transporter TAXI family solute receptor